MNDENKTKTQLITELNELRKEKDFVQSMYHRNVKGADQATKILHDIIEKNPISIQIVDKDGLTIKTNLSHSLLFQAKPKVNFSIFKDPQLLVQGLQEYFERLKKGEVVNFPDTIYNARDVDPTFPDNPVNIKVLGFPTFDDEGNPERFIIMHENITERKRLERELEKKNENLRELYDNFQLRIERERKNLAADLHDNLIQDLTAHKMKLAALIKEFDNEQMNEELRKEMAKVNGLIRTLRNILVMVWPTVIDKQGIEVAIERHSESFSNRYHIKVVRRVDHDMVISKDMAYQLFMIFQEALTNIAKHAHATQAGISLNQRKDKVHFKITDNGIGIGENNMGSKKTFGLLMMHDIVNLLGGSITISNGKAKGTIIDIVLPGIKSNP